MRHGNQAYQILKREIDIDGAPYAVAIDAEGLKLTQKGRRKGVRLEWKAIADESQALALALNASLVGDS